MSSTLVSIIVYYFPLDDFLIFIFLFASFFGSIGSAMGDLEGTGAYRPSAEYVEDSNEALINMTDSTELVLLKLPFSNVSFLYA